MPYKMILFPYEIKISHFDFCYYAIYCFKDRHSGSFFIFFMLFFYFNENEFMSIKALSTVACETYEPFSQFRNAAVIDSCCTLSFLVNFLQPC